MYKAKIISVNTDKTLEISIPSLKLSSVKAYAVSSTRGVIDYLPGDLVAVLQTNDHCWVVIGLIYGAE